MKFDRAGKLEESLLLIFKLFIQLSYFPGFISGQLVANWGTSLFQAAEIQAEHR